MKKKILVVDDEELIRWSLKEYLTKNGYEVILAETGEKAYEEFKNELPNLVLCDIKLPGINGLELLKMMKEYNSDIPVIMITAHGNVSTAVESMKIGAIDYINKPFELDEIKLVLEKTLKTAATEKEVKLLINEQLKHYNFSNIIGSSKEIKEIIELARKIALSETATVLIYGESGTGKDSLAKAIHYESSRMKKPFVEISCAAIPENLLESELFGYEKGAFTDAKQKKEGLFQEADGGTIFLNEIGDMPLGLQAKILRVIEQKKFRALGGANDIEVDVRIISATNKDLKEAMEKRSFREDLYYRLNVLPLKIPSLRERKDDILMLAEYFLKLYSQELRRVIPTLSSEVKEIFLKYHWPGNIRELKNVIERAIILGVSKEITSDFLPHELRMASSTVVDADKIIEDGLTLKAMEIRLISNALKKTNGNQVRAAKLLGVSRDSLRYQAIKLGIIKKE